MNPTMRRFIRLWKQQNRKLFANAGAERHFTFTVINSDNETLGEYMALFPGGRKYGNCFSIFMELAEAMANSMHCAVTVEYGVTGVCCEKWERIMIGAAIARESPGPTLH